MILWIATVVLYGLFWFATTVAVTALGRPSATNAMILAGAWLVLVVLVPSLLNMAATTAYPVPSRVEMIQAMRIASDDATEEGSKLLARYYEDHPELATDDTQQAMNDFNLVRVAVNAEVERRVRPVLGRFAQQLFAQRQLTEPMRFLSPAILVQDALNDVAGTGSARHREFVRQVERITRRGATTSFDSSFRRRDSEIIRASLGLHFRRKRRPPSRAGSSSAWRVWRFQRSPSGVSRSSVSVGTPSWNEAGSALWRPIDSWSRSKRAQGPPPSGRPSAVPA